jgi:hypothetical protein
MKRVGEPICQHCGRRFARRYPLQRYCCKECRTQEYLALRKRRLLAARADDRDWRDAHRKRCVECDRLFWPIRRDCQYCSAACRQIKYRRMHFREGRR